jgi:serine/threonine-protein kinase
MLSVAKGVARRLPQQDSVPERVGPYRLCIELASGGMATVYLGYTETAGAGARFAAVKVVHSHLAGDAAFAEMFVDEAEIASRIRHANVCAVHDFDVSGGSPYIAMEYLVGEPLSAVWRKLSRRTRRGSRGEVARHARLAAKILADACEGLHAAHELTDYDGEPLAVVHRDVSPGNVIVTFDGVAKVVDFGVAAAARKRHKTETGMVKGKFAYIAPECLRGRKADRRADVWAIGVIAWEMATGKRLFRGRSDVETLRAVMDAEIPIPSSVRPGLPKRFDDVVMRALQRDPAERHGSARELGRHLARLANGAEVVTSADIGEWLEELFPGAKERKTQLLELAEQIARDGATQVGPLPAVEGTAPARTPPTPPTPPTPELEPTTLYDHPRSFAARPEPARRGSWPRGAWRTGAAALLGAGVGSLVTTLLVAGFGEARPPATEARAEPPVPSQAPAPRAELRLRPGAGMARGPYLLELVDSSADQLTLRIRLADRAEETELTPADGAAVDGPAPIEGDAAE